MGKYIDVTSTIQVIGNIFKNPKILDNDNYNFNEEDFPIEFHKIIFGSIYNLYQLGVNIIDIKTIEDYLSQRPKSFAVYKNNKGQEYLLKIAENIQFSTFDYYYKRIKKMTLLRMYDNIGFDVSWLYDVDNILDMKKKQSQEDWFDNTSLEEIAEIIDNKITEIKMKYIDNTDENFVQAGDKIIELIEGMKNNPEVGYPLFGPIINTITRGARLGKFYLRSAATGVGKTRSMIADACNFACDRIYDSYKQEWVENGTKEPTLYITTEQEVSEVQTMMLAFLSNVNESHIVYSEYEEGEFERVMEAAKILCDSPIHIKRLPDFSLKDIENTIKFGIQTWNVRYVCFDYLHSSMKILSEITGKSGIKGLREDNILFLISVRLKDICAEYGVFILTSTQLNAEYTNAKVYDQNLLRGAKSIADKIDIGLIMLQVDDEDMESLKTIIKTKGYPNPVVKISVYKNRRGQYKDVLLWCKADRGTCRIEPMFVTDYNYKLVEIEDLKIKVKPIEE